MMLICSILILEIGQRLVFEVELNFFNYINPKQTKPLIYSIKLKL